MSDSKLKIERKNNMYLFSTSVENMFINELLPIAPGDYVKVYLFGLMYAEQERPISTESASRTLRLSPAEIENAWKYWEKWGAVRLERRPGSDDYDIVFLSQIEKYYSAKASGSGRQPASQADGQQPAVTAEELVNKELKGIYDIFEAKAGRLISRTEMDRIRDAVTIYNVTPDVYSYAIKYCAERDKTAVEYITAVALRWSKDGCMTISDVKALLDEQSQRSDLYHKVFDEIGLKRASTPGDRAMIDKWVDEWEYSAKEVLSACRKTAGLREPSLRYVDRVLGNKFREYGGIDGGQNGQGSGDGESRNVNVSAKVLDSYYRYLRDQSEAEQKRRIAEVTVKIPVMNDVLRLEGEVQQGMITSDFSPEARARRAESREKYKRIEKEKRDILVENGYPEDYLDRPYRCNICRDTGVTDEGRYCSCRKERAEEAFNWNRSRLNQK